MTTKPPTPTGTTITLRVTNAAGKQHLAVYVRTRDAWVLGKAAPSLGWLWKCEVDEVKAEMAKRGLTYEWISEVT